MSEQDNDNFFDNLTLGEGHQDAIQQRLAEEKKAEKIDYLIHKVFCQSDEGRELLNIWKDTLIMVPTAQPGSDLIQVGINEGHKQFLRGIYLTVKRVNDGR